MCTFQSIRAIWSCSTFYTPLDHMDIIRGRSSPWRSSIRGQIDRLIFTSTLDERQSGGRLNMQVINERGIAVEFKLPRSKHYNYRSTCTLYRNTLGFRCSYSQLPVDSRKRFSTKNRSIFHSQTLHVTLRPISAHTHVLRQSIRTCSICSLSLWRTVLLYRTWYV